MLDARGVERRRRRAGRSRRVVDAVRRRGPRLQLPPRRTARHADGSDAGPDGGRSAPRRRRDGARRRDLPVRRRALLAAHRARRSSTARRQTPIDTTGQLAADRPPRGAAQAGYQRIDPATRTFQALRIWVNRELEGLDAFLVEASRRLRAGRPAGGDHVPLARGSHRQAHVPRAGGRRGRAPGADAASRWCPAEAEVARNPRARSAKLRAIERLA